MNRLELVAISRNVERARAVAEILGGTLLHDERTDVGALPFRSLLAVATDDPEALAPAADVGAYLVYRRVVKPRRQQPPSEPVGRLPGAVALFTMVHHPALTRREADRHWRDHHAPLALEHHVAMSHYTQLSVVHRLYGPEWHGFALCGFDSIADLRERFFDNEDGRLAIRRDVASFADTTRSPRRLIAIETRYPTSTADRGAIA